jgi:hypothetical protein
MLSALFGEAMLDTDFCALKALWQGLLTQEAQFPCAPQRRWSGAQEKELDMTGVIGNFLLDLTGRQPSFPSGLVVCRNAMASPATRRSAKYRNSSAIASASDRPSFYSGNGAQPLPPSLRLGLRARCCCYKHRSIAPERSHLLYAEPDRRASRAPGRRRRRSSTSIGYRGFFELVERRHPLCIVSDRSV